MSAALTAKGVCVHAGTKALVDRVDFDVDHGEIHVVIGETGSGKTLLAEAIMGTLAPELRWRGEISIAGHRVRPEEPSGRKRLWGRTIALLPQEPWVALDPTMRARSQVAEGPALVQGEPWARARTLASAWLSRLHLAPAAQRRFPFQLSGGMAQRVALAIGDASGVSILIADEPTKGLDADRRDEAADRLLERARDGTAILVITHDIALARRLGGRLSVMLESRIVETGPTDRVLGSPSHAYTRRLIAADPQGWTPSPAADRKEVVVAGHGLSKRLGGNPLFTDLSIETCAGTIKAVTGPSGCGKTTLGNILLGLLPADDGKVERPVGLGRHRLQKIYQDPVASFPPHPSLRRSLADVLDLHGLDWSRVNSLLERMRIDDAMLDRRPHQVSGGELQRIALARALLADPVFLFADEPTSRLDLVTQQEVMDLLRAVVEESGLSVLLVTHDPGLAGGMAAETVSLGAPGTPNSGSR